jgi:hypothetical protein
VPGKVYRGFTAVWRALRQLFSEKLWSVTLVLIVMWVSALGRGVHGGRSLRRRHGHSGCCKCRTNQPGHEGPFASLRASGLSDLPPISHSLQIMKGCVLLIATILAHDPLPLQQSVMKWLPSLSVTKVGLQPL